MVLENFSALELVVMFVIALIGGTVLLTFITGFIAMFFDFVRDCIAGEESTDYKKTP